MSNRILLVTKYNKSNFYKTNIQKNVLLPENRADYWLLCSGPALTCSMSDFHHLAFSNVFFSMRLYVLPERKKREKLDLVMTVNIFFNYSSEHGP